MELGLVNHHVALVLAILLVIVELADVWTTFTFLKKKTAEEGNPIAADLFARFGFWPTVGLKLGLTATLVTFTLVTGVWLLSLVALFIMLPFVVVNFRYV